MTTGSKKSSWRDLLFGHVIAFVGCVLFPGFVTAVAPVSWIKFERSGERVTARARVCMFFFVPYKTIVVDPVEGIGDRFHAGTETRDRRTGHRDRVTKSEDEAFLVIHGPDQKAEVPVTPFNIESVSKRVGDFLDNPQATELKLFVVANWKFSVFGGGLVSLLTVLYGVGLVASIGSAFGRGVQRLLGVSTGADSRVADFHEKQDAESESDGQSRD